LIGANRWQTFWWARLPDAMPMIFAGIELAALYSLLGTIVGEFVGARRGVGVLLLVLADRMDTAAMFALFLVLGAVGIFMHQTVRLLGRYLTRWRTGDGAASQVGA
ncbi:MAG: ABC transporter permease subunit, partial [Actinobacteria bacterium]|nr:ABC transporter permease subunit [Actinomycetota bacterium]